jgi:hypothetical protein
VLLVESCELLVAQEQPSREAGGAGAPPAY